VTGISRNNAGATDTTTAPPAPAHTTLPLTQKELRACFPALRRSQIYTKWPSNWNPAVSLRPRMPIIYAKPTYITLSSHNTKASVGPCLPTATIIDILYLIRPFLPTCGNRHYNTHTSIDQTRFSSCNGFPPPAGGAGNLGLVPAHAWNPVTTLTPVTVTQWQRYSPGAIPGSTCHHETGPTSAAPPGPPHQSLHPTYLYLWGLSSSFAAIRAPTATLSTGRRRTPTMVSPPTPFIWLGRS
jgi:hypothetical protein